MQTTIKQLIREVSDIALHQKQIKSFDYGEPLTLIKKRTVKYAALWMNISVSSFDEKKTTFNIEFFCMDRVNKDDRNKVDVENTTSRILRDIYNIIRFSTRWQDFGELVQSVQNQKYYDYTADRVTGWGQTISFNVWNTDCFADLPMGDYDFNQTIPIDVCDVLAIVKNTDNDILATKLVSDSDNVIEVPNITITDSDGTEIDYPSGVNFTCTAGGGSGDVEVNGVNVGTYNAPNTFELDVINGGSNQVGSLDSGDWLIGNTEVFINAVQVGDVVAEDNLNISVTLDGTNSGTWNSGTQTWEVVSDPCADATVTVNGNAFATVPSGDNLPIQLLDGEGNPYLGFDLLAPDIYIYPIPINVNGVQIIEQFQGTYSLDILDQNNNPIGTIEDPNTVRVPILNTANLTKTGQTTSYAANDDGDLERGRGTAFATLSENNPFGNANRFTDTLGGQTYADNIMIDWSQWNQRTNTVNGYCSSANSNQTGTQTWANWMSNSPYTCGAFGNWYLANILEMITVMRFNQSAHLNYAPLNISANVFSSTTNPGTTTQALGALFNGAGISSFNKTGILRTLLARTFTITGTTLS